MRKMKYEIKEDYYFNNKVYGFNLSAGVEDYEIALKMLSDRMTHLVRFVDKRGRFWDKAILSLIDTSTEEVLYDVTIR